MGFHSINIEMFYSPVILCFRQLIQRFHCISCDRPVDMMPTGYVTLTTLYCSCTMNCHSDCHLHVTVQNGWILGEMDDNNKDSISYGSNDFLQYQSLFTLTFAKLIILLPGLLGQQVWSSVRPHIFRRDLVMKFLWPFSPYCWFK